MNKVSQFYRDNGYYVAKGVFSTDEFRDMERDFDRIVSQLMASKEQINARWGGSAMERIGAQTTEVIHTHHVQHYSAVWTRVLLNERLLDITEQLIGPNIILHHTKLFQKPPQKGAPFPMHQDWNYFPTIKDTMVAAIIHVSEATDEMGCLRIYPGSHKLGRMIDSSGTSAEFAEKYPLDGATIIEAEPGDVVFFHYFTLHGSKPNVSTKTRKTMLAQFYAGDDQIEPGFNDHGTDQRLTLRGWNFATTRQRAWAERA